MGQDFTGQDCGRQMMLGLFLECMIEEVPDKAQQRSMLKEVVISNRL